MRWPAQMTVSQLLRCAYPFGSYDRWQDENLVELVWLHSVWPDSRHEGSVNSTATQCFVVPKAVSQYLLASRSVVPSTPQCQNPGSLCHVLCNFNFNLNPSFNRAYARSVYDEFYTTRFADREPDSDMHEINRQNLTKHRTWTHWKRPNLNAVPPRILYPPTFLLPFHQLYYIFGPWERLSEYKP